MASLPLLSARLLATRSSTAAIWRTVFSRCTVANRCCSTSAKDQTKHEIEPSDTQKRILVWTKTYKKLEDIPPRILESQMKRAMDRFRARSMVVMMGLAFLGFYLMILSGRRMRDDGDSLTRRGTIQEQTWREQGRLERQREEEQKRKP